MTASTEPKFYSFNLFEASEANPTAIQLGWNPRIGTTHRVTDENKNIDCVCNIEDDQLVMSIEDVDEHNLIWDFINLDDVENYLYDSKDLPIDIKEKLKVNNIHEFSGADFASIPREIRQKAVADFKFHGKEVNKDTILDILESSYLFAWAKAQVEAGNFKKF